MNSRISFLLAAALLFAAHPAPAAEQWTHAVSPDFDLWTDAGEHKAREAMQRFEEVRGFFAKASPLAQTGPYQIRVVAFQTQQMFRVYAYNQTVNAYFTSNPRQDFIVMQEPNPENYKIAIHEYFHAIVRHSGLRLPVWLNEGWADVYSTLRPVHDGVAVGDLIPYRMTALEKGPWMNIAELLSVTTQSPAYSEGDRVGIFYAESWALVHMLYLSPEYKDHFGEFLRTLHRTGNVEQAFEAAWKKNAVQISQDLQNYTHRKKLYGVVFEAGLGKSFPEPKVTTASLFDSRLLMTELDDALGRTEQAREEYKQLGEEQPQRPEIPAALGFLALQKRDFEGATELFRKAFALGSQDARMCMQLSTLLRQAKRPTSEILPVLERAAKLRPDVSDLQIMLGLTYVDLRSFREGLSTLTAIPTITPDRVVSVYCAMALASIQLGDVSTARSHMETCKKYARSEPEKRTAEQLSGLIEGRAASAVPPQIGETIENAKVMVEGIACTAAGSNLVTSIDGKETLFVMPEPKAVEFSGKPMELRCGKLAQPVPALIEYVRMSVINQAVAGLIRRITF